MPRTAPSSGRDQMEPGQAKLSDAEPGGEPGRPQAARLEKRGVKNRHKVPPNSPRESTSAAEFAPPPPPPPPVQPLSQARDPSPLQRLESFYVERSNCCRFPVHAACFRNDVAELQELVPAADRADQENSDSLDGSHSLGALDDLGFAPLHVATCAAAVKCVRLLAEWPDVDVNLGNSRGWTAMHFAARYDRSQCAKILLDAGAHTDSVTKRGFSVLDIAARYGATATCVVLCGEGELNPTQPGAEDNTPLHHAASRGHTATLDALVQMCRSAALNARNAKGWSALELAVRYSHLPCVSLLLEAGCSPDDVRPASLFATGAGWTSVHWACYSGDLQILRALLGPGRGDWTLATADNSTTLMLAAMRGHEDIVAHVLSLASSLGSPGTGVAQPSRHLRPSSSSDSMQTTTNASDGTSNGSSMRIGGDESAVARSTQVASLTADHLQCKAAFVDAPNNDGTTALIFACRFGHEAVAKRLLRASAQVNLRNHNCSSALHLAVCCGHRACVQSLVAYGADVNAANAQGFTPLMWAACFGYVSIGELLMECEADVSLRSSDGWSVWLLAASKGHTAFTDWLCATHGAPSELHAAVRDGDVASVREIVHGRGVPVEYRDAGGWTPFHWAAYAGQIDCMQALLELGASVECVTAGHADTPLHVSASQGRLDSMDFLLTHGASVRAVNAKGDPAILIAASNGFAGCCVRLARADSQPGHLDMANRRGSTALHWAAFNNHVDCITVLLVHGATCDVIDEDGRTPLLLACSKGHVAAAQALLRKGPDVNLGNRDGWAPLHFAAQAGQDQSPEIALELVRMLLGAGADVEAASSQGWTAMHCAAAQGDHAVVQELLEHKAQADPHNVKGFTPLLLAAVRHHEDIVRLLAASGAENSLSRAASAGRIDRLRELLNAGMMVDAEDSKGYTALHCAARHGQAEAVEFLLQFNASISKRTRSAMTAIDLAARYDRCDALQHLVVVATPEQLDACNSSGWNPLLLAAHYGATGAARILLQAGASGDVVGPSGSSAVHLATSNGHYDTLCVLLQHGCPANLCSDDALTPLHLAASGGYEAVLRELLEQPGVDVDAVSRVGNTPLMLAVRCDSVPCVALLLARGASPVHANSVQETCLHWACNTGTEPCLSLVLTKLRSFENVVQVVNLRSASGTAAIHWAAARGHFPCIDRLLELRDSSGQVVADVNTRTGDAAEPGVRGWTALMLAARRGHLECVEILLHGGADPDIVAQPSKSWTALFVASAKGRRDIVRLLLAHGCRIDITDADRQAPHQVAEAHRHPEVAKLLKTELRRTRAAHELLSTEMNYVASLDSLVTRYLMPLRRASEDQEHVGGAGVGGTSGGASPMLGQSPGLRLRRTMSSTSIRSSLSGSLSRRDPEPHVKAMVAPPVPVLPADDIRSIFSSAQAIRTVHRALLERLKDRVGKWRSTSGVGDLFESMEHSFEAYDPYTLNHAKAQQTMARLRKNRDFDQWLRWQQDQVSAAEQGGGRGGPTIDDLLIKPVQRICQIPLTLLSMIEYTPSDHPDRGPLKEAHRRMKALGDRVNESRRATENRNKMSMILSQFSGSILHKIVSPTRRHVRDGMLTVIHPNRSKRVTRIVYLFNDLLVFAVKARFGHGNAFESSVQLHECWFQLVPEHRFGIRMCHRGGNTVLIASNLADCDAWLHDLRRAVAACVAPRGVAASVAAVDPPGGQVHESPNWSLRAPSRSNGPVVMPPPPPPPPPFEPIPMQADVDDDDDDLALYLCSCFWLEKQQHVDSAFLYVIAAGAKRAEQLCLATLTEQYYHLPSDPSELRIFPRRLCTNTSVEWCSEPMVDPPALKQQQGD